MNQSFTYTFSSAFICTNGKFKQAWHQSILKYSLINQKCNPCSCNWKICIKLNSFLHVLAREISWSTIEHHFKEMCRVSIKRAMELKCIHKTMQCTQRLSQNSNNYNVVWRWLVLIETCPINRMKQFTILCSQPWCEDEQQKDSKAYRLEA